MNPTDLLPDRLKPYAKAVVALLVGGLAVAFTALDDGTVSAQEWVGIALGALGVGGVYGVRNDPR